MNVALPRVDDGLWSESVLQPRHVHHTWMWRLLANDGIGSGPASAKGFSGTLLMLVLVSLPTFFDRVVTFS